MRSSYLWLCIATIKQQFILIIIQCFTSVSSTERWKITLFGKEWYFCKKSPQVSVTHSPQWVLNPRPHFPTNYYRIRICQLRYSSLAKLYYCAISEISLIWVIFMCVLCPKATWKIIRQQLMKFEFDWVCVWDGWNFKLFLLFSLFLLLFIGFIALFRTIHRSYCTILATF